MLVEGRHFRLDWSTPHDVGRKAVAQNAADIEAMGARVTAFVVGFGAPPRNPGRAGQRAGRRDVGRGRTDRRRHRRRRPGQQPAVGGVGDRARRSGRPSAGAAVRGAAWLADRRRRPSWAILPPDMRCGTTVLTDSTTCGDAIWCRNRRIGQGAAAAEAGAQAMIDVSDGLVGDLRHVAEASGVGVDLSTDALTRRSPRRCWVPREAVGVDPWPGCSAGERTMPWSRRSPVRCPTGWRVIGRVLDGPARVLVDGAAWRRVRRLAVLRSLR